ncbi:glycosylated lysosomal membrane protein A-like [Acanthaster planci]|uniref:Glycosylated lysosomal membrane protein A-like n=1 Tax=Acanthaster planci TaxID=133434 RepID=A0A8B7YT44_ACAPL|nr:glycosylated lysosomal membrane protein A-like [Acanthaster planci]
MALWVKRGTPLVFCILLALLAKGLAADRKLSITYNEQCDIPECMGSHLDNQPNLVHVTGTGDNDTVHFLWSSIGTPTFLLARTTHEAQLVVNWAALLQDTTTGSISFKPADSVLYSSALMFTKLIEYNDTEDDGMMKSKDVLVPTVLNGLQWQNTTINQTEFSAMFNTSLGELGDYGTIAMKLTAFSDSGRLTSLPHLPHTENSTQLDLTMQNLTSNYVNTRFALEMMVVGSSNGSGGVELKQDTTIDDQYTPGTFSVLNLKLPNSPEGSYLQWKPVSYVLTERTMENARHVYQYNLDTKRDQIKMPNASIAHAFFSAAEMVQVGAVNISFGITKDGFFKKTNYTSWSASFGYGKPPEEYMTLTVYIVISVGLGLPLIIVVFGGTGVCISKHRQKKRNRSLLTN